MQQPLKQRKTLHKQLQDNEDHILALEQQIRSTQKLATLGTMACLVAHEFNNILMPMINYAELALKHQDDTELMRKALEKTILHGNRAALVIENMLNPMRDQSSRAEDVALRRAVDDCFQALVRDFSKDQIHVNIDIPDDLTAHVVPGQLQQVLLNLIINARQAMLPDGGNLTIAAQDNAQDQITLRITDTGSGIDPEHLEHIFEPFFTTKNDSAQPDQQGTGLGLSICRDIITAHHGDISVHSVPGEGTTFTITLPRSAPADQ